MFDIPITSTHGDPMPPEQPSRSVSYCSCFMVWGPCYHDLTPRKALETRPRRRHKIRLQQLESNHRFERVNFVHLLNELTYNVTRVVKGANCAEELWK